MEDTDIMKSDNILVTGGCGFIGIHVLKELLERGYEHITVVDNLFNGRKETLYSLNKKVEFVAIDINSNELSSLFMEKMFSVVINLAAIHYIPYCDKNPRKTCRVNIEGSQALLDLSIENGIKRFFQTSTAAVYENKEYAYTESDKLLPMDIYGISKVTNEFQVRLASEKSDCIFSIGRIFNAVGAFETNPHLVPELIRRLKESNTIEIGNTETKRDYIHVKDIAKAIVTMTFDSEKKLDICNIGSGKSYTGFDVVNTISRILNKEIKLVYSEKFKRKVDRLFLLANNDKIKSNYNWKPVYTLEDALKDAIDYEFNNPQSLSNILTQ